MRTTLTLEPDVTMLLKRRMEKTRQSLKHTINEALRAGLPRVDSQKEKPFKVKPYPCRFKPGIDLDKIGQFADQLEAEETVRKLFI
jgi:hypothetical protein